MADNVTLPGTGQVVRTVEIDGKDVQVVFAGDWLPPLSFETAAITTADDLPSIPAGAQTAVVLVEGGSIRYRPDGVDPTDEVGMLVVDGQTVSLPFGAAGLAGTRVIAADGTPTISVVYS